MKFDIKILFFVVSAVSVHAQKIRGAAMERSLDGVCTNDAPFAGLDQGCSPDSPLCARSDGYEPAADVAGDYCGKCRNVWDTDTVADWGCTESEPACDAELGLIGMRCMPPADVPQPACKNTGAFGATDQGCTDETPICYNADTQQEVGSYAPGTGCARCLNSFVNLFHKYGVADYGCPKGQPRCVNTDGSDPSLNKVGSRCCPAGGCPVTCPCNTPNTIFSFLANDPDVSQVPYFGCAQEYGVLYGEIELIDGSWALFGAGEVDLGVWACGSMGQPFESGELYGISPDEGRACQALIQGFSTESGVQCFDDSSAP